jgi:hypothetical protein
MSDFILFYFILFYLKYFIYLFESESQRERESMSGGGDAEAETDFLLSREQSSPTCRKGDHLTLRFPG